MRREGEGSGGPAAEPVGAPGRPGAEAVFHVVLSRGCAHLYSTLRGLLESSPGLRVLVDRRRAALEHPVVRPPAPPWAGGAPPPVRYHMVIRRDCAHLYERLLPLFTGRPEFQVLVDRRVRSRTPAREGPLGQAEKRRADPPVWVV